LHFLRDEINRDKNDCIRTIYFIDSINKTHEFNISFRAMLPESGKVADLRYLSEHFSSATLPIARARILKDFADPIGIIKLLFTTVSYGMGIDNKTVHRVVVNDLGKDANDLWQKIGRACRDGTKGEAVLMTRGTSPKGVFMKGICIRHSILSKLMGYHGPPAPPPPCACMSAVTNCSCNLCSCCEICKSKCKCNPIQHRPLPNPAVEKAIPEDEEGETSEDEEELFREGDEEAD
jgi:hypothetical protein